MVWNSFLACTVLVMVSPVSFRVKESVKGLSSRTAFINLRVTLIEMFAFVTLFRSDFILMNSSTLGWLQLIESIKAPLLPFCPISPVTWEYKSIKETAPDVCFAALWTFAPLGASLEISTPTPPP